MTKSPSTPSRSGIVVSAIITAGIGDGLGPNHAVRILDEAPRRARPAPARTILDVVRRRARTLVVISQE